MLACRLCHICTNDIEPTLPDRVHASSGAVQFKVDSTDKSILETLERANGGSNPPVAGKAESKARACAELLLMAMNISEEVVARQDAFYQKQEHLQQRGDATPKRGGKPKNRQRSAKNRNKNKGNTQGSGQNDETPGESPEKTLESVLVGQPLTRRNVMVNDEGMDGATKAWLTSVMGSSNKTVESAAKNDLDLTKSVDVIGSSSSISAGRMDVDEATTPAGLLNQDQVECLKLAISYLPKQEMQAIQFRLRQLLEEGKAISTSIDVNV